MTIVIFSILFGIFCFVIAKDKLERGRGGRMTREGEHLILIGIGAIVYALIQFVGIVITWFDRLLTNLTNFVNALLPVTLARPWALLLVVGIICLVVGIIGAVIPYCKAQSRS